MTFDLSILLLLRDLEPAVAGMVRDAQGLGRSLDLDFEIVALDERSGDNTLSVLSILHARIPELRTLQDLSRGSGLSQASRAARGRLWLLCDHPTSAELMRWAILQLREHGRPAAIVPGEVLAVTAAIGAAPLRGVRGGLTHAQRAVEQALVGDPRGPAWRPAPSSGVTARALRFVRQRLGGLGPRLSRTGGD